MEIGRLLIFGLTLVAWLGACVTQADGSAPPATAVVRTVPAPPLVGPVYVFVTPQGVLLQGERVTTSTERKAGARGPTLVESLRQLYRHRAGGAARDVVVCVHDAVVYRKVMEVTDDCIEAGLDRFAIGKVQPAAGQGPPDRSSCIVPERQQHKPGEGRTKAIPQ